MMARLSNPGQDFYSDLLEQDWLFMSCSEFVFFRYTGRWTEPPWWSDAQASKNGWLSKDSTYGVNFIFKLIWSKSRKISQGFMRNGICLSYRPYVTCKVISLISSHRELIFSLVTKISANLRPKVSDYYSIIFSVSAPTKSELGVMCVQINQPFQITNQQSNKWLWAFCEPVHVLGRFFSGTQVNREHIELVYPFVGSITSANFDASLRLSLVVCFLIGSIITASHFAASWHGELHTSRIGCSSIPCVLV